MASTKKDTHITNLAALEKAANGEIVTLPGWTGGAAVCGKAQARQLDRHDPRRQDSQPADRGGAEALRRTEQEPRKRDF